MDITILLPTLNKVPAGWAEYHKEMLLKAADGAEIITISKKPMWGTNIIEDGPEDVSNLYHKFVLGCKAATTPYIGIAEDDTLYTAKHFAHRPPLDKFAYNMNRWGLFTWGEPIYFYKPRSANCTMIAPRELFLEILEREFALSPDGLTWDQYRRIGTQRFDQDHYSEFLIDEPVVSLSHIYGVDPLEQKQRKLKWPVQAYELPVWGQAKEVVSHFV